MFGQPFGGLHLLVPTKAILGILREHNVVRRIGINEVVRAKLHLIKTLRCELPSREHGLILRKAAAIVDRRVAPERNVELATAIETAAPVVGGGNQIIKKGSGFPRGRFSLAQEFLKSVPTLIEKDPILAHLN